MEILENIKLLGGLATAVLSIIMLTTALVKPVRNKFVSWLNKTIVSDIAEKNVNSLNDTVDKVLLTLKEINEKQDQQSRMLKINADGLRASIGNSVKHIYYTYLPGKALPAREKEAIVSLYAAYKKLNGNYYVKLIFEEMMDWEILDN